MPARYQRYDDQAPAREPADKIQKQPVSIHVRQRGARQHDRGHLDLPQPRKYGKYLDRHPDRIHSPLRHYALSGTRLSGLPDRPKDHRRGNTRLYLRRRRSRRRAYRAAERLYFLRQNPQYALRRNHQRNDGIQAGENYAARRASGIYLRHPARYRRFRTYLGNAGKRG